MNSHVFIQSLKTDIQYCKYCGCLSYKNNIRSSSLCPKTKSLQIDPLKLKYQPISLKPNYDLPSHRNYLAHRIIGISKIISTVHNFGFSKLITYKAIGLMDQIFLSNNEINIRNIEIIAYVCILISVQFNECCTKKKNQNETPEDKKKNFKGLFHFIKNEVKNLNYWEMLCLKYLDYDLGKYTAYDYLLLFFELGIVFTNDNIDLSSDENKCIFILDTIINDSRICYYSHYILALSVINLVFENNSYFNKKDLKSVYGIDLNKEKYNMCKNKINIILNDFFYKNNNSFYELRNGNLYNLYSINYTQITYNTAVSGFLQKTNSLASNSNFSNNDFRENRNVNDSFKKEVNNSAKYSLRKFL